MFDCFIINVIFLLIHYIFHLLDVDSFYVLEMLERKARIYAIFEMYSDALKTMKKVKRMQEPIMDENDHQRFRFRINLYYMALIYEILNNQSEAYKNYLKIIQGILGRFGKLSLFSEIQHSELFSFDIPIIYRSLFSLGKIKFSNGEYKSSSIALNEFCSGYENHFDIISRWHLEIEGQIVVSLYDAWTQRTKIPLEDIQSQYADAKQMLKQISETVDLSSVQSKVQKELQDSVNVISAHRLLSESIGEENDQGHIYGPENDFYDDKIAAEGKLKSIKEYLQIKTNLGTNIHFEQDDGKKIFIERARMNYVLENFEEALADFRQVYLKYDKSFAQKKYGFKTVTIVKCNNYYQDNPDFFGYIEGYYNCLDYFKMYPEAIHILSMAKKREAITLRSSNESTSIEPVPEYNSRKIDALLAHVMLQCKWQDSHKDLYGDESIRTRKLRITRSPLFME